MPESSFTVTVSRDLEDLIPGFMKNRSKELESLRAALTAADYEQMRQLGHRMRGVGNSYGFAKITTLGTVIEEGARRQDRAALDAAIVEYQEFLGKVTIVYD